MKPDPTDCSAATARNYINKYGPRAAALVEKEMDKTISGSFKCLYWQAVLRCIEGGN